MDENAVNDEGACYELWATGMNAWNQLGFQKHEEEPSDLQNFERILSDCTEPWPILAGEMFTLVQRGEPDNWLCQGHFDLHEAVQAARDGCLYAGTRSGSTFNTELGVRSEKFNPVASKAASQSVVNKLQNATQLAAGDAHFIALMDEEVYTWGTNSLKAAALGREYDDSSESWGDPGVVPDFSESTSRDSIVNVGRVVQVAAGGHASAVLTADNDVYMWGTDYSLDLFALGDDGVVNLLDIDGVPGFASVALGDKHAILLATDGRVWVNGSNEDGQLGIGQSARVKRDGDGVCQWTQLMLDLPQSFEVVSVAAGPMNSFLWVKRPDRVSRNAQHML